MSRRSPSLVLLALTLCAAVLGAAPATAAEATTDLIVAVAQRSADDTLSRLGRRVELLDEQVEATTAAIRVRKSDVAEAVAVLEADPTVEYVERDVVARATATPADQFYSQQWGTGRTGVPTVWDDTKGAGETVIAVVDTGVNTAHPDFVGAAFLPGRDFVNGDDDPADDNGHGTATAGVIVAQHNTSGTAGICPKCAIMPLKVLGPDGTGSHSNIAAAINYAVANGADIVNLSLGSAASTTTLSQAVAAAHDAGVLVVAAAGNEGLTTPFHPAAYPGATGVAGANEGDAAYSWSNTGNWVDVAAPGCNLGPSYSPSQAAFGYGNYCGTSSAAPFVAGVAGLLKSRFPAMAGPDLRSAIRSSAVAVPYVASGRVDAAAALAALGLSAETPPPPDGGQVDPPPPPPADADPIPPGDDGETTPQPPPVDDRVAPPPPTGDDGVAPPPVDEGTAPPYDDGDDRSDRDPAVETATTLAPSATRIALGDTARFEGRLSSTSGDAQGRTITLLKRSAADADWVPVQQQTTDASGAAQFTHQPSHSAKYRLRFDGDGTRSASLSDIVTITVAATLAVQAPARHVLAGRSTVVTGTFAPPRPGAQTVLQRRSGDAWDTIATDAVGADSAFRFVVPAPVGQSRYRVRFAGDRFNAASMSATVLSVGDRTSVASVQADAAGADRANLNGERIVIRNTGLVAAPLQGWTLRSRSAGSTFTLPAYRLPAGARVVVHSGRGPSGNGHLYLGADREVWANRRDVAVLRHAGGGVAARVSW